MRSTARVRRLLAAMAAGVFVAAGVGVMPASAAAPASKLVVRQDAAGKVTIQQGRVLKAGLERIDVSSAYSAGDPETFQLRGGATLKQMAAKMAAAGNWQKDPKASAAAMRWFVPEHIMFYGGLSAQGAVDYQTVLPAGCYYAAQVNDPAKTARRFHVVGDGKAFLPKVNQWVRMEEPNTFVVHGPGGKLHSGALLITNQSQQLHFARFVQVKPGTTDADVTAWLKGGADPSVPGGQVYSFGTQSPGRAAVADLALTSGTYALLDFIPDTTTGIPHAFGGMHTVVRVS